MNTRGKHLDWLEITAAFLLGLAFLASGIGKMAYPFQFFRAIEAYRLVNAHIAFYVAIVLPSAELLVALCLLTGIARSGAFACAVALGLIFVFVNASVMVRNMVIPCGCFGGGSNGEIVGIWTLLRAVAVLIVAAMGLGVSLRAGREEGKPGTAVPRDAVEIAKG